MGGSWAAIAGDTRSEEKSGSSSIDFEGADVVIEGMVWLVFVGESIEMEGMGEMGEMMWFVVGRGSLSVVVAAEASIEMEGVEIVSWFAVGRGSLSVVLVVRTASEESMEMDGVEKTVGFVVGRGSGSIVLAAGAEAEVVVG